MRTAPVLAARARHRAAAGHAPAAAEAGAEEIRRVDAQSRSACCSPTPRSATRTSRCWPRACARYDMLAIADCVSRSACRICSAWRCGAARRSTRRMRFLHEDPWQRLRELREAHSQHLLPDAAARVQRRRLHRLSRQRGRGVRPRSRTRRASTSSASSIR